MSKTSTIFPPIMAETNFRETAKESFVVVNFM